MSTSSRTAWRDLQGALQQGLQEFLVHPEPPQWEAVLAHMRAYADAARTGNIDIPQRWISTQ
ncbi:MAG: hypothetical protein V4582_23440 [Pseudomonadota bacterium]